MFYVFQNLWKSEVVTLAQRFFFSSWSCLRRCYAWVVTAVWQSAMWAWWLHNWWMPRRRLDLGKFLQGKLHGDPAKRNLPANEHETMAWEDHRFFTRRLHFHSWLVFHCHGWVFSGVCKNISHFKGNSSLIPIVYDQFSGFLLPKNRPWMKFVGFECHINDPRFQRMVSLWSGGFAKNRDEKKLYPQPTPETL